MKVCCEVKKTIKNLRLPKPPIWLIGLFVCGGLLAANLASRAALARYSFNDKPRIHLFQDMDNQPKSHPQGASVVFSDGYMARPHVQGTIPFGSSLVHADTRLQGTEALWSYGYETAVSEESGETERVYLDAFPMALTEEIFTRGQRLYHNNCASCHGFGGHGDGPVHARASELATMSETGTSWAPVANLTDETRQSYASGRIFEVIREGANNMYGMSSTLSEEDAWAITAYVRVLQDIAKQVEAAEAASE